MRAKSDLKFLKVLYLFYIKQWWTYDLNQGSQTGILQAACGPPTFSDKLRSNNLHYIKFVRWTF